MHNARHHYKVFPSAVLKWPKVWRIKIIQKSLAEALNRFEKQEEERLRTFARNFSNIDFFLKLLPLKDDELAMSEM